MAELRNDLPMPSHMQMMLYLDTTVPSAFLDERAPDRRRLTERFWRDGLQRYLPVISTVVLAEIRDTPDKLRRAQLEELVAGFGVLPFSDVADNLAREYVKRGVFPEKYVSDAIHVAIAVSNGAAYLASWNFRHLVKVNTRREVNLVNSIMGFGQIEIVAPPEL